MDVTNAQKLNKEDSLLQFIIPSQERCRVLLVESPEYLTYVREHPIHWAIPTQILYAGRDNLTSRQTVIAFAQAHRAGLTVMEDGEHWFHTPQQLAFLDAWLTGCLVDDQNGTE